MAGANRLNWPRRCSIQFWPIKRAHRPLPRIRSWAVQEAPKLLGYVGYKAGMTHVQFTDTRPNTLTKNMTVTFPVTIVECPSLLPVSLSFYKKTIHGPSRIAEVFAEKLDKSIKRPKNQQKEPNVAEYDEVRLKIMTQPKMASFGKKNHEMLEIPVSGPKEQALAYAKQLLTKEIKASEIFKEGQFVDIHSVTKGHGFQGTVKRFGVKIRQHKSEKTKRGVGTLGPWTPKRVRWSVAQPGKMGFHTRTEYNKHIIKIDNKPENINPKGGLSRYGQVKNEYLLIKGSVAGVKKRTIILTESVRVKQRPQPLALTYIHKESQQ